MKILLISGSVSGEKRYGKLKDVGSYMPPYGLLCIAAVLEKGGHEVKVLDTEIHNYSNIDICSQIDSYKPDLIGMSVFTIGSSEAIERAKAIKLHCNIPIAAGGPHIFVDIDNYSTNTEFDFFVVGEGEQITSELVDALENGKQLSNIAGLVYREDGKIMRNPSRTPIHNLDDIPLPAFHLIQSDKYKYHPSPLGYRFRPFYPLVTSRGCPFKCVFCSTIWGKNWRANSAEYVVNAFEKLMKDFGAREIWICEDTFGLDKKRVEKICLGIIEKKLKISWACMTNVHVLDEKILSLMKKAGCWQIQLGLESGNNEVLKFIGKPITVELIREKVNLVAQSGIQPRAYFILDHLIDTKKTMQETIDLALSLPLYSADFHLLQLPLGSEAREIGHEYGQVNYNLDYLTGYASKGLSFVPKGMTEEYLFEVQRKAHLRFFLRPSQFMRMVKSIKSFEDVKRFYLFFKAFLKSVF